VDRAGLAQTVLALTVLGGVPVALTTGLVGAGGFGKTMLAAKACHDRAVRTVPLRGVGDGGPGFG